MVPLSLETHLHLMERDRLLVSRIFSLSAKIRRLGLKLGAALQVPSFTTKYRYINF